MNYKDYFMNHIRCFRQVAAGVILILSGMLFFAPAKGSDPDSTPAKFNSSVQGFIKAPVEGIMNQESNIRAGLLYDMDRKVIVWEKDMNYAYPVASLTKMMVALLAVEDIKNGKASWTDEVMVTRIYYKGRRHKTRYSVQERFTLDDLVRLAMINSNNEATVWIGKHLAGGELDPFIRRMNEKCQELGMHHTFFSNPSGLPASSGELDNSSSPNDLLILSLELIKYPEILDITKTGYASIGTPPKSNLYRNHNGLVIQYPEEVDGLKTGYTKNARFCLSATAIRGGRRLVCIVLGARSPYERNNIVAGMMNNYFGVLGLGRLGESTADPLLALSATDSLNRSLPDCPENNVLSASSQALRKVYVKEKKTHTVRKGETLYAIADRYECYASEIKKWNRLKSSYLKAGQRLVIYQRVVKTVAIHDNVATDPSGDETLGPEKPATVAKALVKPKTVKTPATSDKSGLKGKFVYHVVQPGDTLWNIAQRYSGTTVDAIKKVNRISNTRSLKPGTKLKIQVNS